MPVTYPNAKTYKGDFSIRPIGIYDQPKEGPKSVKIEINWLTYTSPYTISVNLDTQFGAGNVFTKVAALYVDNSDNLSGVTVFFTDSQFGQFVPAQCRQYIPVVTGQMQFYVLIPSGQPAPSGLATTIISILNVFVPPSDPTAQFLTGTFVSVWNGGIPFGVEQWGNNLWDSINPTLASLTNASALFPLPAITAAGTVVITGMQFMLTTPQTKYPTPAEFTAANQGVAVRLRLVNAANNQILLHQVYIAPWGGVMEPYVMLPVFTGLAIKTTGLSVEAAITIGPNVGAFLQGAIRAQAWYRPLANGE